MLRPRYSQADQPAKVSRTLVDQVARQAERLRRDTPYPGNDPRGKGQRITAAPMIAYAAIVTSSISQASGTTFGSGYVQVYGLANSNDTALSADTANLGTSCPVSNWYTSSGTIATGKHCFVISCSGVLWLLTWEC